MGFGVSSRIAIARSSRTNQQFDESEGSLGQADYWEACANYWQNLLQNELYGFGGVNPGTNGWKARSFSQHPVAVTFSGNAGLRSDKCHRAG
jgi:hypothetical protein